MTSYFRVFFLGSLLFLLAFSLFGAGPGTVYYQGTVALDDSNVPQNGYYPMKFSLWNTSSGGTEENNLKWSETYDTRQVLIMDGHFAVTLGGLSPFSENFFRKNKYLWLQIQIDLDRDGFEEGEVYEPRTLLSSTPYASVSDYTTTASVAKNSTYAKYAETLAGLEYSEFARTNHNHFLQDLPGFVKDDQVPDNITIGRAQKSDLATTASYAKHSTYAQTAQTIAGIEYTAFSLKEHTHKLQELQGAVTDSQVPNDITVENANQASLSDNSLQLEGKSSSYFASSTHNHNIQKLVGPIADSQVPDDITINYAAASGTAGDADSLDGFHASHFSEASHSHNLQDLPGAVTDNQVPDNITVDHASTADDADTLDKHDSAYFTNADNINAGTLGESYIDPSIARKDQIAPEMFDAVVALSGGDYTSVQNALSDNHRTIFVRNGIYTLSSDIVISENATVITGESRGGVIFDCNQTGNGIKIHGDSANYEDGTASIAFGSKEVYGSGTLWSSNASAGEYMFIRGRWYEIRSVNSDTHITIDIPYKGRTASSITYKIASLVKNVTLRNFTMKNFCEDLRAPVELWWTSGCHIQNCEINYTNNCGVHASSNYGFFLKEACSCKLVNNYVNDTLENAIHMENCSFNGIINNSTINNGNNGICLLNSSHNTISANSCNSNMNGIYLDNSSDNTIESNMCINNSSGINSSNSYRNTINSNTCRQGINGVKLSSSSNENTISGNVCNYNTNGIQINSCMDNILTGNSCSHQDNIGIYLNSSSNNVLNANKCAYNSNVGVYLNNNCDANAIVGNSLTNNDPYGLHILGADCESNLVGNNILVNNASAPAYDQGTDTEEKYHNYPRGF